MPLASSIRCSAMARTKQAGRNSPCAAARTTARLKRDASTLWEGVPELSPGVVAGETSCPVGRVQTRSWAYASAHCAWSNSRSSERGRPANRPRRCTSVRPNHPSPGLPSGRRTIRIDRVDTHCSLPFTGGGSGAARVLPTAEPGSGERQATGRSAPRNCRC